MENFLKIKRVEREYKLLLMNKLFLKVILDKDRRLENFGSKGSIKHT